MKTCKYCNNFFNSDFDFLVHLRTDHQIKCQMNELIKYTTNTQIKIDPVIFSPFSAYASTESPNYMYINDQEVYRADNRTPNIIKQTGFLRETQHFL